MDPPGALLCQASARRQAVDCDMTFEISTFLQPRGIKALRTFVIIVESGGLSAAQARLGCSLSYVSRDLTYVEKSLGLDLCQRGRDGFALTEVGLQVYEAARSVLDSFSGFDKTVSGMQDFVGGELRIATNEGDVLTGVSILPQVVERLLARPGMRIRIRMEIGTFDRVIAELVKGDIHVAFSAFPSTHSSVLRYALRKEAVSLYCGRAHTLYARPDDTITAEELEQCDFARRPQSPPPQGYVDWSRLRVSAIAPSMEARAIMVTSGRFLAMIPDHYADQWVARGKMRRIDNPRFRFDAEAHMVVRNSKHNPAFVRAFVEDYFTVSAELGLERPRLLD